MASFSYVTVRILLLVSALATSLAMQSAAVSDNKLASLNRAEWLHQARWGVMIHYLGSPGVTAEDWNRGVDGFDVNVLAEQLKFVGAGYLLITIGQNSGHFIAPNQTYDSYTGIDPSKCSRRDLVSDLAQALKSKGLRLMVYLPSGAPEADLVAVQKLGWQKGSYRNLEFENKWEKVIAEWSIRWGAKVSGWWFDGCYWPNTMYRHSEPPNFTSFAAAARKGNPASIVAFNAGVEAPIISITGEEDYTAGETNEPLGISCPAPRIDGVQWHVLTYLGEGWGHGKPRFGTQQFAMWGTEQIARGGAITWEVPADSRGTISQEFLSQLKAFGQAVSNH